MRKREKRIAKELKHIGTTDFGHGWAARQASKRHNTGRKLSQRAINRREGRSHGG